MAAIEVERLGKEHHLPTQLEDAEPALPVLLPHPLLVDPADCPLPVLDSTRTLARAALERALVGQPLSS